MSVPVERPAPASSLMPDVLPPIVPVRTPSPALRLWTRFQTASRHPEHRHRVLRRDIEDTFAHAMLVDDIAAVLGPDFAFRSTGDDDMRTWTWRTAVGEIMLLVSMPPDQIDALTDAVMERLLEDDRSVDAAEERAVLREIFDGFFTSGWARRNGFGNRGLAVFGNLDRVRRALLADPATATLTNAMLMSLVRLKVLEELHFGLMDHAIRDAGATYASLTPRTGTAQDAISGYPHLSDPTHREFDRFLCGALIDEFSRFLRVLTDLGEECARHMAPAAPNRSDFDDAMVNLQWLRRPAARRVAALDARMSAMRLRFGEFDANVREELVDAFRVLPVTDLQYEHVYYTERVEAHSISGESMRIFGVTNLGSESRQVDAAGVPLDDLIRRVRAQIGDEAMDVAVAARLHAWIGSALPARLGVIDELERVTAQLNAPVMDRLDGRLARTVLDAAFVPVYVREGAAVAETVFAALAPMPRREVLWRLATPEGLQIARAIALVGEVTVDRQRRGVDRDPRADVTFDR